MTHNFWKDKKVLITGIHGFVGSNLCKFLIKLGANVYGIYRFNSTKSLLKIENINNYNSIQYTENNFENIDDLITDKEINICFHLASQVEVQKAFSHPYSSFKNNLGITLELLEVYRKSKILKSMIITSTDKVYGDVEAKNLPYREILTPNPKYPYEVSKYLCESMAECYRYNYKLPIIITRTSNIFGPGQLNFSALIPSLILSALKVKNFYPRSNGLLERDYFYIEDWVKSLIKLSEYNYRSINKNLIYNFGSGKPLNAIEITKKIFKIIDNEPEKKNILDLFKNSNEHENEIKNQFIDATRSKEELGINYNTKIEIALSKTIDWYLKFYK